MNTRVWDRTPWFGRVVVRGPRGIGQVLERLDRLDSRSVDGSKVRRRRSDGVVVWRRSFEYEVLLPVLRGRVVDAGSHVEIRASIRPAWMAWMLGSYGVAAAVGGVAAALQDRTLRPLLYLFVPIAMAAVARRRPARRYRADVEAAERVLCSLVAGQVVERRDGLLGRAEPAPSHP